MQAWYWEHVPSCAPEPNELAIHREEDVKQDDGSVKKLLVVYGYPRMDLSNLKGKVPKGDLSKHLDVAKDFEPFPYQDG